MADENKLPTIIANDTETDLDALLEKLALIKLNQSLIYNLSKSTDLMMFPASVVGFMGSKHNKGFTFIANSKSITFTCNR